MEIAWKRSNKNRNKDDGDAQALTSGTLSLHSQPSLMIPEPSTFSSLMRGKIVSVKNYT
jgi:hypothetical protein